MNTFERKEKRKNDGRGLPERHDIVSTDEILQRADEVMYEYKRKHKEKYLKQLEK